MGARYLTDNIVWCNHRIQKIWSSSFAVAMVDGQMVGGSSVSEKRSALENIPFVIATGSLGLVLEIRLKSWARCIHPLYPDPGFVEFGLSDNLHVTRRF